MNTPNGALYVLLYRMVISGLRCPTWVLSAGRKGAEQCRARAARPGAGQATFPRAPADVRNQLGLNARIRANWIKNQT
ncbi:hypothetical protein NDU88_003722 [Pleurodeles waltl]|uniref:Uncharacterized protein n=1 Tax=Pleurodeles waltl TaxID=8319 RepID=A0AAV7LHU9_PLEWA|nr:hypothetical protein NDU88_003722 [Pleurodeles waltl]